MKIREGLLGEVKPGGTGTNATEGVLGDLHDLCSFEGLRGWEEDGESSPASYAFTTL